MLKRRVVQRGYHQEQKMLKRFLVSFRDHTVNARSGGTRLIILRTFAHHGPALVKEWLSAILGVQR
jgi:hypothetical protein